MKLLHGTTRWRAEQILLRGPDPKFQEPGGGPLAESISMSMENGPFPLGRPEDYACRKANLFPDEGGPVILVLDVPDDIVQKTFVERMPVDRGVVQFDFDAGLEELLAAWPMLSKSAEIRSVP